MRCKVCLLVSTVLLMAGCSAPRVPATAPAPFLPSDKVAYKVVQLGDPAQYARIVHEVLGLLAVSDARSQSVIVKGPPESVDVALVMIDKLDAVQFDFLNPNVIFSVPLKNARAGDVAKLLETMEQKGFFVPDPHSTTAPLSAIPYEPGNLVWVLTTRTYEGRVKSIIEELDRPLAPATQPQPETPVNRIPLTPRLGQ